MPWKTRRPYIEFGAQNDMAQNQDGKNTLARKLKRVYEALRRRSTPGYRCGAKFDDLWFKLASVIDGLGACPITYLEAQFENWGGVPFPPQLCSNRAITIYKKYRHDGKTTGKLEFEHQVKLLRDCAEFYQEKFDGIDEILGLDFVPLKPFLRVLLCGDTVLPQILEKYGAAAAAELRSNPSLEKHIKENYVSRYQRLFPQRLSEGIGSSSDPLPGPTRTIKVREGVPRRRRLADT